LFSTVTLWPVSPDIFAIGAREQTSARRPDSPDILIGLVGSRSVAWAEDPISGIAEHGQRTRAKQAGALGIVPQLSKPSAQRRTATR